MRPFKFQVLRRKLTSCSVKYRTGSLAIKNQIMKLILLPTLLFNTHSISGQGAGKCGDIINDPFVNLNGINAGVFSDETNSFSNLEFDGYCGDITTPNYGFAEGKVEDGSSNKNTYKSVCRIQCKDWSTMADNDGKSTAKLVWVRTEKRWMQTKYLQCLCKTNGQGEEVCRYKRRGYRGGREGLRGYDGGTKEKALQISCLEPGCVNPALIPEFSDPNSSIPELFDPNTGSSICTNCDLNNNRGGTWKCFDNDDNELPENSEVPKAGYCKLTCPDQPILDQEKVIRCQYPHHIDNLVNQYKHVWRTWKFLNNGRYKRLLGNDNGWTCSNQLSDENIDPNVKVILNSIDTKRSRKPNSGKGQPAKPFVLPINGGESTYDSDFGFKPIEFDRTIAQIDFTGSFSLQFTVKNILKLDNRDCGLLHGVEDSEDPNNLSSFQLSSDGRRSMFPFIFIQGRDDSDYYLGVGRSACFRESENLDEPIDSQTKKWDLLTVSDNDAEHEFEIILINNEVTIKVDGVEHGTKKTLRDTTSCQNLFRKGILLKSSSQYLTPCSGQIGDISYTTLCDSGTHVNQDNTACETNVCSCNNGVGFQGEDCPSHGQNSCQTCDSGYYLNQDGSCALKICSCENGTGATGSDCPNNNDAKCISCDSGYNDDDNNFTCQENQCTCANGTPTSGANCPVNNAASCVDGSCDSGYFLNNDNTACNPNTCSCSNGVGATGADCPTHNANYCASCTEPGSDLTNGICTTLFCSQGSYLDNSGSCVSYGSTFDSWTYVDKSSQNQPSVVYKYFSSEKQWNQARNACRQLFSGNFPEAQLASITDAIENTAIENLRPDEKTWIGGYCSGNKWYWLEGSTRGDFDSCFDGSGCSGYERWGSDYDNCAEPRLELSDDRSKKWNDKNNGNDYPYICQVRLG